MKIKTTKQEYELLILDLITEKMIIVKQVYFISYKKYVLKNTVNSAFIMPYLFFSLYWQKQKPLHRNTSHHHLHMLHFIYCCGCCVFLSVVIRALHYKENGVMVL